MKNQIRNTELPQIKGLLFDKDGTLFDYQTTWGPWAESFISQLAKGDKRLAALIADSLGFDSVKGSFYTSSAFIAGTTEDVIDAILFAIPDMTQQRLAQLYLKTTSQAELRPPVPLEPLLTLFKQNSITMGVATNDHEKTAVNHLSRANIETFFEFIVGFDSGYGAKPEPGMQYAFCKTTQLEPQNVAMVGDTLHDIESGNRAGMSTIGVLTGMLTREELAPYASVVLDDIGEIPRWLGLI